MEFTLLCCWCPGRCSLFLAEGHTDQKISNQLRSRMALGLEEHRQDPVGRVEYTDIATWRGKLSGNFNYDPLVAREWIAELPWIWLLQLQSKHQDGGSERGSSAPSVPKAALSGSFPDQGWTAEHKILLRSLARANLQVGLKSIFRKRTIERES